MIGNGVAPSRPSEVGARDSRVLTIERECSP
jgi:hypothetical protein